MNAQVVCATCIGVGSEVLERHQFGAVLMDEATQATEASTMVSICRGAQQLVLIGDQCQLPPTVASRAAQLEGLDSPLFNRLISANGVQPHLLNIQYRMHPAISMFPTDLFYSGMVSDGVTAVSRPAPSGFMWPRADFPVAFIPVEGHEQGG